MDALAKLYIIKYISDVRLYNFAVAPLAGAWIEICVSSLDLLVDMSPLLRGRGLKSNRCNLPTLHLKRVAPLAGAWIEILIIFIKCMAAIVAPLAGAWIEIEFSVVFAGFLLRSPLLRGRGLKLLEMFMFHAITGVAPLAGAWIEICHRYEYKR